VAAGAGWQPAIVVVVALLAVVAIVMPPLASPTPHAESSTGTLPGRYWWAWGVLVLLIAVEFSYSVWATTLVAQRTGAETGAATSTLTVLILFLALGRIMGARLALRMRPGVLLLVSVGVTAAGWAVLWTATTLPMAIVGMSVSGLGMAFHFPLGVSRSLEASGGLTDIASGRIALGAGLAIGLAPFVLGAVSDAVGVHGAFLLVPLLLGLAAALLVGGNLSARPSRGRQRGPSTAPVGTG
jgi:fucose permease